MCTLACTFTDTNTHTHNPPQKHSYIHTHTHELTHFYSKAQHWALSLHSTSLLGAGIPGPPCVSGAGWCSRSSSPRVAPGVICPSLACQFWGNSPEKSHIPTPQSQSIYFQRSWRPPGSLPDSCPASFIWRPCSLGAFLRPSSCHPSWDSALFWREMSVFIL